MQTTGTYPGKDWQIDFMDMCKTRRLQYLLAWVDTFTRWIEVFPCRTEKAKEVVWTLVNKTIPQFRLPKSLPSDTGPVVKAAVTQRVSPQLWKYSITSIAIGDTNPQVR